MPYLRIKKCHKTSHVSSQTSSAAVKGQRHEIYFQEITRDVKVFSKQSLNERKPLGKLVQEYDLFIEEIEQLAERCDFTEKDLKTLEKIKTLAAETFKGQVDIIPRDINLPSGHRTAATREVCDAVYVGDSDFTCAHLRPSYENQMNILKENLINEEKKNVKRGIQALFRNLETIIEEREAFAIKYQLDDGQMKEIENEMKENKSRLVDASSLVVAVMSHGTPGMVLGECIY